MSIRPLFSGHVSKRFQTIIRKAGKLPVSLGHIQPQAVVFRIGEWLPNSER
jgi:hypothetical protein